MIATHEYGLRAVDRAAGGVDHVGQVDPGRDLDDPRLADPPADGEQDRTGLLRCAQPAIPGGAITRDQGDMGEGLDVLHQGRPPTNATVEDPGRARPRQRRLAVERRDHRRLLAGDVAIPRHDEQHRPTVGAAAGPLGQRAIDRRARLEVRAAGTGRGRRRRPPRRRAAARREPGAGCGSAGRGPCDSPARPRSRSRRPPWGRHRRRRRPTCARSGTRRLRDRQGPPH